MSYESISLNELTQYWPIFERIPQTLLSNLRLFKLIGSNADNALLIDHNNRSYFFGPNYKEFCCSGLNQQDQEDQSNPVEILPDISVKDVVYTEQHVLMLDIKGKLYSWVHECCDEFPEIKPEFNMNCMNENDDRFIRVECGRAHVVALTHYGKVCCWNERHQQLIPDQKWEFFPNKIKLISCGLEHTLAVDCFGKLYTWGNNNCGQLAIGKRKYAKNPILNTSKELFKQICAGRNHSLLLSYDGKVYGAGDNRCGQVCESNCDNVYYLKLVNYTTKKSNTVAIGTLDNTSVAINSEGQCLIWGEMKNNKWKLKHQGVNLNSVNKALARYCPFNGTRHMVSVDTRQKNSLQTSGNNFYSRILPFPLEQSAISSSVVCVNPFLSRLHRLFDSAPESDICFSVLQSDCRTIFANRWFLQNSCDYFGVMLSDRWLTNSKRDSNGKLIVEIGASLYSVYYSYLAFLYTGELVVRDEDQQCEDQVLFELFDLALCNGQSELSHLCIDRLFHSISIANCCQLYQISSLYGPQLESEQRTLMDVPIEQFITNNLDLVLRSSQFASLDSQLCKQLVIQFGTATHSSQFSTKPSTNLAQVNQIVPNLSQFQWQNIGESAMLTAVLNPILAKYRSYGYFKR